MVLDLKIINKDAQLNNFFEVGSARFVPGFPVKINMRLFNSELKLRHVPSAAATFAITLKNSDGTTISKVPTALDAGDRSLLTMDLTGTETSLLIGQKFELVITDGSDTCIAVAPMGLQGVKGDC